MSIIALNCDIVCNVRYREAIWHFFAVAMVSQDHKCPQAESDDARDYDDDDGDDVDDDGDDDEGAFADPVHFSGIFTMS